MGVYPHICFASWRLQFWNCVGY